MLYEMILYASGERMTLVQRMLFTERMTLVQRMLFIVQGHVHSTNEYLPPMICSKYH